MCFVVDTARGCTTEMQRNLGHDGQTHQNMKRSVADPCPSNSTVPLRYFMLRQRHIYSTRTEARRDLAVNLIDVRALSESIAF